MAQGEKGKPIKGINAIRDPNSGAVVSHDQNAYQRAVKKKRAGKLINIQDKTIKNQDKVIRKNRRRIKNLESKMDEILKFIGETNGQSVN